MLKKNPHVLSQSEEGNIFLKIVTCYTDICFASCVLFYGVRKITSDEQNFCLYYMLKVEEGIYY